MADVIEISPVLTELQVGERAVFPARRMDTVKVIASNLGFKLNRRYKTRSNREARTITVTRVS